MREVIFIGIKYFLGANSGEGFYSLYDSFARNDGDLLYLIKGGPGCGKSGFMRRISEKAQGLGYEVEEILCSGDPDSLDAVYIPEIKTAFCDATAPHAAEPRLFAVDSYYVNLGQFCSLSENSKIAEYSKKYKQMYKSAYSYLSPLAGLKRAEIPDLYGQNEIRIAKSRAKSAVTRNVSKLSSCTPKSSFRFIHCISCLGELCLEESLSELCKQIYLVDDRCGLSEYYLNEVRNEALSRGHDVTVCPSPLCPEKLDAVIIPDSNLGFISASILKGSPHRHIRLDLLADLSSHKNELKIRSELSDKLMSIAMAYLEKAKHYHDMLEEEYRQYMDFDALDVFTGEFINKLFHSK